MELHCTCGYINIFMEDYEFQFFLISNDFLLGLKKNVDLGYFDIDRIYNDYDIRIQETYRCEKCKRFYIYEGEFGERIINIYAIEETLTHNDDIARTHCSCGHTIQLKINTIPEFFLLNDDLMWDIDEEVESGHLNGNQMYYKATTEGQWVYSCEKCKRLYIYEMQEAKELLHIYLIKNTLNSEDIRKILRR